MQEQNDGSETPYERGARRARELHNEGSTVREENDGTPAPDTPYERGAQRARDRRPSATLGNR